MTLVPRPASTMAVILVLTSVHVASAQAPQPAAHAAPTPTVFEQPALVSRYESTITGEELSAHLYLLASDFFEGRESATRGQKLAAYYLASEYQRLGLTPMGSPDDDSDNPLDRFLQPFPVFAERLQSARLTARVGERVLARTNFSASASDGGSYLAAGTIPEVSGPMVFAGYGIADNEFGYNDFEAMDASNIDYKSSWIMILRDEPLQSADKSRFPTADGGPSVWTTQPTLKYLSFYRQARPKGVLVVGDAGPRGALQVFRNTVQEQANEIDTVDNLSLRDDITPIPTLPIWVISSELADQLLAPAGRTVADVQTKIDSELEPVVFAVPDVRVDSRVTRGTARLRTENVVAMVEGSDPLLKDEYVVVSSHYDHIGLTGDRDGDRVFNGADDDGSGTVATLEMAEAFQKAREDGYGPRRSVLFINFSGEEQGLLGSEYFADKDPRVPLDSIVTDLNMDMIGRVDPTYQGDSIDYVYVIGSRLISEELHEIAERVNLVTGKNLTLDERFNSRSDPNRFYARSDHWNFGKHGIPFIFFFTGTHEDYHQPGDEPQKILYGRLANITKLIFGTAWQVANQDSRPAVSGKGFN